MRRRNARRLTAVAVAALLGVASSVVQTIPVTIAYTADEVSNECIAPSCSSGDSDPKCSGQHIAAAATITTARVPEPTMVALLGLGLLAFGSARKYLNG